MDNKIFKLGLSVEAISLYLILADLLANRVPLQPEAYTHRWNSSPEALEAAIVELVMHNVVERYGEILSVQSSSEWRLMQRN